MRTKTVFVHKIVRNGYSEMGNSRFRLYTNLGSINMMSDAAIGFSFDNNNPNNSPLVGKWVELTMFRTTFSAARLV